ncbi:MAG: hypothetical protein ACREQQ_08760, partial [Candidatus Binatia bacterium]
WVKGGFGVDDAVELARRLREHGCDLVEVLAGHTLFESAPRFRPYYTMLFSDRIRNEAGIPTLIFASRQRTDEINSALASGRADLCCRYFSG